MELVRPFCLAQKLLQFLALVRRQLFGRIPQALPLGTEPAIEPAAVRRLMGRRYDQGAVLFMIGQQSLKVPFPGVFFPPVHPDSVQQTLSFRTAWLEVVLFLA